MKSSFSFSLTLLLFIFGTLTAQQKSTFSGTVYIDENANGFFDKNERGVAGVCVSNGKDVVQTNKEGRWELKAVHKKQIFLIKPAGFAVPVNNIQIPQHFVKDEQVLTSDINFPLLNTNEKKKFSTLFFGDTQARGMKEVNYIFHDVVEELIGTNAVFGVSLGDIVADEPELMKDVAAGIAHIGIPWYNVFGNHDYDRGEKSNDERDATFQKFFGPSTYAFEYSEVVFIALNNIFFTPDSKYITHFTDDQLAFVKNYLDKVSKNKLVVLMMHSPIVSSDNREEMYRLLESRKHTFSISGHVHEQINVFINEGMGWKGDKPHHHLINATVCGSWWCGLKDEVGIPHATMNDGAPNGYSVITFDGNKYSVRFKAARRPDNYQMNIYLPEEIEKSSVDTTTVLVNVFAGSENSVVEMSIDNRNWIKMESFKTIDPEVLRMHELSPLLNEKINGQKLDEVLGWTMDYPSISHHIWKATLPSGIQPGTHKVSIRAIDMFDQPYFDHRIFRVK
ncbi:MAG TPA: calcineurin-like phosphoesterase C-terminal domain-containing protein [Dysgonamonadaceae bacterium]|nr:calcineurin-like phosphoesterase C-terminal domain-containing protein [Dysgonamonadaceae bacterium]